MKALGIILLVLIPLTMGWHTNQEQYNGPAIGETIDLRSVKDRNGRTLAEAIKVKSLAMVVVVNPNCGACTTAKDSLRSLRERAEKAGFVYYVLMIPDGSDTQKYFAFADSLNLKAESFVWSTADAKPPASLVTMTVPSHLLLTNEGLVVDKWLGIDKSASIQQATVNRIVAEAVAHLRSVRP